MDIRIRRSSRRKLMQEAPHNAAVPIDLSESKHGVVPDGLNIARTGFDYFEASKHRSCWVHILALKLAKGKKWRNEDEIELELFKRISPCHREIVPGRDRSKRNPPPTTQLKDKLDSATFDTQLKGKLDSTTFDTQLKDKLDSTTFDACFRRLWDEFLEDKKASFAYLDCLWFNLYYDPVSRQKVLSWIKKEAPFSKKYVIVPIVLWDHWNLLILCNFDENLESSTRKPCMLLLDSLEKAGPKRYEPVIRKFVVDVFKALGRTETRKSLYKIPCIVPKVLQQTNDVECGHLVLYFIHLFVHAASESFDISDANFVNEYWLDRKNYEHFCQKLIMVL